jgi:hypothetical protein
MKMMSPLFIIAILGFMGCGGSDDPNTDPQVPDPEIEINISPQQLSFASAGETRNVLVSANATWTVVSDEGWCSCSPGAGYNGETSLKVTAQANHTEAIRNATLTFTSGSHTTTCSVSQAAGAEENYVPDGYTLTWQDEFNEPRPAPGKAALPNTQRWWYETGAGGWGNNELQNYIAAVNGADSCAMIADGTLKIIARKSGSQVLSVRMNSSQSWKYGYFEARMKLPVGNGTWPAFWMLPKNFKAWPDDGEIDIMEEVGYRPNYVSSSIHCKAYYHSIGTQKTAETYLATAQTDFHVYAVEWTAQYIKGYADGKLYFEFRNDGTGNKDTWPFYDPFYLKLNLAWGGNWGGAQGVDESFLPAVYEIDYVRVYQKD